MKITWLKETTQVMTQQIGNRSFWRFLLGLPLAKAVLAEACAMARCPQNKNAEAQPQKSYELDERSQDLVR